MKLQSYREKEQVINTTEKKSTNTTTSKKSYGRTKRQKRTFAARLPTLIAGEERERERERVERSLKCVHLSLTFFLIPLILRCDVCIIFYYFFSQ